MPVISPRYGGVWEMESMNANTQKRVPSGGDRREPQRPDL